MSTCLCAVCRDFFSEARKKKKPGRAETCQAESERLLLELSEGKTAGYSVPNAGLGPEQLKRQMPVVYCEGDKRIVD